jgi:hypothetical protein
VNITPEDLVAHFQGEPTLGGVSSKQTGADSLRLLFGQIPPGFLRGKSSVGGAEEASDSTLRNAQFK